MITPTRKRRKPTLLQRKYLSALQGGRKKGKLLRRRLRSRGVQCSDGAFYRVMQRLKNADLVRTEPVPKPRTKWRGPQCYYELTPAGQKFAGPKLQVVKGRPRRRPGMTLREMIAQGRVCRSK